MPKITPLQVISGLLGLAGLVVASMSQHEDIRSEVEEAVETALNGRDAKLLAPKPHLKA